MTEYQLRILFVVILCAPVAYFGIRFFISLVNNAVAGRRAPADKKKTRPGGKAPGRKDPERRG
jgi:hypothetical protein